MPKLAGSINGVSNLSNLPWQVSVVGKGWKNDLGNQFCLLFRGAPKLTWAKNLNTYNDALLWN